MALISACCYFPAQAQCGTLTIDDISFTYQNQNLLLSWPDMGALGYRFSATPVLGGPTVSTTQGGTSFTIPQVPTCTGFFYTIETICADGSVGFSSEGTVTSAGCPIDASQVVLTSEANGTRVTWPDAGLSAYTFRYRVPGEDFQDLPAGNNTIYTPVEPCKDDIEFVVLEPVSGLELTEMASFRAIDPCTGGSSGGSSAGACRAPNSNSFETRVNGTAVTIIWDDSGANSYLVKYRPEGETGFNSVSSGGTAVSIGGLDPCTTYQFKVVAQCPNKERSSRLGTFTTEELGGGSCGNGGGGGTCTAPDATALPGPTSVAIVWDDAGAASYEVNVWPTNSQNLPSFSDCCVNGTSKIFSGLAECQTYDYEVASKCSGTPQTRGAFMTLCLSKTHPNAGPVMMNLRMQVAPQPANEHVTLQIDLPETMVVDLQVVNVEGKMVRRIAESEQIPAGPSDFSLNVRDLPNGIYLVRMSTPLGDLSQKLMVRH